MNGTGALVRCDPSISATKGNVASPRAQIPLSAADLDRSVGSTLEDAALELGRAETTSATEEPRERAIARDLEIGSEAEAVADWRARVDIRSPIVMSTARSLTWRHDAASGHVFVDPVTLRKNV